MTDPYAFLRKMWSYQPPQGHAFVTFKDWQTNGWQEHVLDYPIPSTGNPEGKDMYFAPVLFKEARRLKQFACGGQWLFADLDEVDPSSLGYLPPQVAWETSPGRYQAAWRLEEPLGPKAWERLNRAVTYRTGADRGGWSLTKVLRVPGSVSTKHGFDFTVRVLWARWEDTVAAADVRRVCSKALPASDPATGRLRLPKASAREIRRTHWQELSPRARKLLRAKTLRADDDRSARLWELENLCLDAGMTPGETVKVVRETIWNKFKGQRREMRMLEQDALRAEALQRSKGQVPERRGGKAEVPPDDDKIEFPRQDRLVGDGKGLPNVMLAERFISSDWPKPSWMVEGIWGRASFGWWAGEFKAYKTWTVIDFAVSVASGTPFLNRFEVVEKGPVMYVHDEGKEEEVARQLWRVKTARGLTADADDKGYRLPGRAMPLWICSFPHLDLTVEEHRAQLVNEIRSKGLRVLILEAWYLMSGAANENEASEVNPITKWLMQLSKQENCAIVVSHHYNKGAGQGVRAGHRMSGSGVFARSFESAVYLERRGAEEDHTVLLTSQHRAHTGLSTAVKFVVREDMDEDYQVLFLTPEELAEMEAAEASVGFGSSTGGRAKKDLGPLHELEEGEAMRVTEAASLCGVTVQTIRNRLAEGKVGRPARVVKRNGVAYVVGLNGSKDSGVEN